MTEEIGNYYFVKPDHELQLAIFFIGSHLFTNRKESIVGMIDDYIENSNGKVKKVRSYGHLGPTFIDFKSKDEKFLFLLKFYNGKKYPNSLKL